MPYFTTIVAYIFDSKEVKAVSKKRRALNISLLIIASIIAFLVYLFATRLVLNNADNGSVIMEASSMVHNSHILRGWFMPSDNFITIDIPLYAIALLFGLKFAVLLKVVPAMLYTFAILLSIFIATRGLSYKKSVLATLAVLGFIGFPSYEVLGQVLQGPIHIGTIVFTLIAFALYYFYTENKFPAVSLPIMLLFICLSVIGDPLSVVVLVLPILSLEIIRYYRSSTREVENIILVIGTIAASGIGFLVRSILISKGVHILVNEFTFSDFNGVLQNITQAIYSLFILFHADVFSKDPMKFKNIPVLLNFMAIILLCYGFVRYIKGYFFEISRLDQLLVFAVIGNLLAFVLSTYAQAGGDAYRYLLPLFFFLGILSFKLLFFFLDSFLIQAVVITLFTVNALVFAHMSLTSPSAVQPESSVIPFLEAKGLNYGLGSYWASADITAISNGEVTVRQSLVSDGQIHPFLWLSDSSWYDAKNLSKANFIIYQKGDDYDSYYNAAVTSFGTPKSIYVRGNYIVLVWDKPLLSNLQPGIGF